MPYNLLLLPLIGGFLFLHITHYYRFAAQRLDGYRLLFQTAIVGILLSAIARLVIVLVKLTPLGVVVAGLWRLFSPFAFSGTSALALLMGPAVALIVNQFLSKSDAQVMEIERHGNSFLRLLSQAERENLLISITLDTRKWYVGWVAQAPNLDPQEQYFKILPFLSGYRDKDTLITHRSVFYGKLLEEMAGDTDQFHVTLPLKDVKIASLFNDEAYNQYFAADDG